MSSEKHNSGYQNRKSQEGETTCFQSYTKTSFVFLERHVIQMELKGVSNRAEERSKFTCPSMSFNKKLCFY